MPEDPIASSFYIIVELVIAAFSVLGNVLVCWAVCLNSNLQSITNLFVVSLAVADIAVGVLAIPFAVVISTGFCSNFYGCLFMACFVLVLTQSSIFSLLAIAIDRYIAIQMPLRYNGLVTGRRAQGIIAVCWVLSIVIGLTPMLGWHKPNAGQGGGNTTEPNASGGCLPGLMRCTFEGVVDMEYMVYFNFLTCVLIPLLVMLAIYLCIFMVARRQLKLMELKAASGEKPGSTLQREVQVAKSLAIIVGLFAVCWLPLHIINGFTLFCPQCARPPLWLMYVAILLSHGNSVVNPFIYAYRIREFRRTFRRILRRHLLSRRERPDTAGSMRTSVHSSVGGSPQLQADGPGRGLEGPGPHAEQSSGGSSRESSEPCLGAAPPGPLAVVLPRCPAVGRCPPPAPRNKHIPGDVPLQCVGPRTGGGAREDEQRPDARQRCTAQVTALFERPQRALCFEETAKAS